MTTSPCPTERRSAHRIRSISVIGGFLDGTKFELADGLNCIIGARGTGKTTVLEFVRFVLDALPSRETDPAERRRVESLLERNLGDGRVQIEFQTKEGLTYILSRSWGEEPLVLSAEGQPTKLTLKAGGAFRADIYSQNEVERIADRTISQLVLIDNFVVDELPEIDAKLRQVGIALATSANQITPLEGQQAALREELSSLPGVEEKLKALAVGTGGSSDAINQAHAQKALRDREKRAIDSIAQFLQDHQEDFRGQAGLIAQEAGNHLVADILGGPNGPIFSDLAKRLLACGHEVDLLVQRIWDHIAEVLRYLEQTSTNVLSTHSQQEMAFRALVEKHAIAQGQTAERTRLERLRNELLSKKRAYQEAAQRLAKLYEERTSLLQRLSELRDKRFALRRAVVGSINERLAPSIRVAVEQYGDFTSYQRILEDALKGSRLKHVVAAQRIAAAVPPSELSSIVKNRDSAALVDQAGLNAEQADKVVAALAESDVLFALETVELIDKPRIELKDGETFKDSLSLSTGQKCTSILPILLLDSDRPLLVDQPEDNLDNGFIYETVVGGIRVVKSDRQMIFVTHNPNIPVLGDADKVFVLKSNGVKAWKEKEGTVDDCKAEIVTLLEGGEEAFVQRQKRYKY